MTKQIGSSSSQDLPYTADGSQSWSAHLSFTFPSAPTVDTTPVLLNDAWTPVAGAEAFRRKYEDADSDWGKHSGSGSDPYFTIEYRGFLEKFMSMNGVRSVVDVGCGDFQFMRLVDLDQVEYLGLDVVESVVRRNSERFGTANRRFALMPPRPEDVPGADLLIMKDVLQHLPDQTIFEVRDQLLSKFRYHLITNSYRKMNTARNVDVPAGGFRCLDLTAPPYSFGGCYVLEYSSALFEHIRTLVSFRI